MIERALFDSYSRALSEAYDLAHGEALALLAQCADFGGSRPWADVREELAALAERYGAVARTAASEFLTAQWREGDAPLVSVAVDAAWTNARIQRAVSESATAVGKAQAVASLVMKEADAQMVATATASKAKWALVAHAGACQWCLMFSSRGWVYSSRQNVEVSRHSGCRCTVVADTSSTPSLSGYDAEALYRRIAAAQDAALATIDYDKLYAAFRADGGEKPGLSWDDAKRSAQRAALAAVDWDAVRTG